MTMRLYKLFSCNAEVQYRGSIFSKAMFFTVVCAALKFILPFIVAYRSRGFWLKSDRFYEQPKVHFAYEYLLIAETDEPSRPILCGEGKYFYPPLIAGDLNCPNIEVRELDNDKDGKNEIIEITFQVMVLPKQTVNSLLLLLALHYQLKTVCPLQMQSLAVITKEFPVPPSGFKYYGDLHLYQLSHLPCAWNNLDTTYNYTELRDNWNGHKSVDEILEAYYSRTIITQTKTTFSRIQNGNSDLMLIKISLRIPSSEILYKPGLMQELKWAWPQYLSLAIIFHWIFNRIKGFVFNKRLLMAWKEVPWKKI